MVLYGNGKRLSLSPVPTNHTSFNAHLVQCLLQIWLSRPRDAITSHFLKYIHSLIALPRIVVPSKSCCARDLAQFAIKEKMWYSRQKRYSSTWWHRTVDKDEAWTSAVKSVPQSIPWWLRAVLHTGSSFNSMTDQSKMSSFITSKYACFITP